MTLQATQVDNIYLADLAISDTREKVYKMPQIDIHEVDMQRNTAVALDYVAYQLSRQIKADTQTAGARVCKQQHKAWDNTPVQIQPGLFSSVHNRLYKPYSSKIACSRFFPLTVQTTEGWVALMPHLTGQPEPAQLPNEQLWRAETEEF
ncbi:MAG: hypothetical protein GY696_10820, partial [Gammaproteobacteria bacterium]|nr:hypothetical protein [Gammaproteobacteria bacterium]